MSAREERRRSPRRDEAKAGTRRRVLAAAMEVFAREGYHAARMDAIAEAAGVSKGALYFHFPGKLPLFSALVDEFAAQRGGDAVARRRAARPRGCGARAVSTPAPFRRRGRRRCRFAALSGSSTSHAELSTYPPSSTDADSPRLARALVVGSPRSRDRSMLAKAKLPIGR
jgi:AcrR family transcriptional regulator